MTKLHDLRQRVAQYRASKATLFWTCVGSVAATLFLGFVVSGWVTKDTATEMVEEASDRARMELAASVCVDRFMQGADVVQRRAALDHESYWKRSDAIEAGGWTRLPRLAEPVEGLAAECASRILEAKVPPAAANPNAG